MAAAALASHSPRAASCATRQLRPGAAAAALNSGPSTLTGISVDTGADVSKDAADVILLEKSLLALEQGVERGRFTHGAAGGECCAAVPPPNRQQPHLHFPLDTAGNTMKLVGR